jgi:deoxyribonuclease-4
MKKFLLGAHMPTTGGFYHAAHFGQEIGCSAIQIFTKSNRQWSAKPIDENDAEKFKRAIKDCQINYVVAHASYLINLASPSHETQEKSILALQIELERCNQLAIPELVLHPGSKIDLTNEQAILQVSKNINTVLNNSAGETKILLETMAGQGSTIGNSFEQIAQIIANVKKQSQIGVCLDTCHIFAAGYDFENSNKYLKMWQDFEKKIGLKKLNLIHLNDSKKELGARVDRHAEIGDGKIGIESFRLIMNDHKLIEIPKILETPKENLHDDQKNMQVLIDLLTPENKKYLTRTNLEKYLI